MIVILSPSKTMAFDEALDRSDGTEPIFKENAAELMKQLKPLSRANLEKLMSINQGLATLTAERIEQWSNQPISGTCKPAVNCFKGAVYTGLDAANWSSKDFAFAQKHVRILSGLYGVLRPLDRIQPYRLEMGLKWSPDAKTKDLYAFWSDKIQLAVAEASDGLIVNLASKEYAKAAIAKDTPLRIVTPEFKERVGNDFKAKMAYAKEARGCMAKYIIQKRVTNPGSLKSFQGMGYAFNSELSTGDQWVFTRDSINQ
jgi:hypothetical protein